MPHRPSAFDDFRNTMRTWTVGNVSVADDDDQDRLGRFLAELDRRPTWKATFLDILGRTGNVVAAISGRHQPSQIRLPTETAAAIQAPAVAPAPVSSPYGSGPVPKNPMRFSVALERFRDNALKNKTTVPRTIYDRHEFLQKVGQYVVGIDDRLDKDPWIHHIHTHHLAGFMDASAERLDRQESKETHGSHEPVQPDEDRRLRRQAQPFPARCVSQFVDQLLHQLARLEHIGPKLDAPGLPTCEREHVSRLHGQLVGRTANEPFQFGLLRQRAPAI